MEQHHSVPELEDDKQLEHVMADIDRLMQECEVLSRVPYRSIVYVDPHFVVLGVYGLAVFISSLKIYFGNNRSGSTTHSGAGVMLRRENIIPVSAHELYIIILASVFADRYYP